jgi:putative heme-binding domain-containing protein
LQERGRALPDTLRARAIDLARSLLAADQEGQARAGVEFAKEVALREAAEPLARLAERQSKFPGLRVMAVEALAAVDAAGALKRFDAIVADGADGIDVRRKAAQALAGIDSAAAREALLKHLASAPGALALDIAQGLSRTREGCQGLLTTAEHGKASAALLQDRVVQEGLNRSGIDGVAQRVARLTAGLPSPDERTGQLIEHRRGEFARINADAAKGQAVFKKICAACHKIGGEGNKIGPELDGIGLRGFDRILEDVLDPSRTVDQAFRSTQVLTKGGLTVVGLKLRTDGEVLVLANNEGKEVRVPVAEIDKQAETRLSPMPANIADTLPPEEFYHLVKFLLSQQQQPPKPKAAAAN